MEHLYMRQLYFFLGFSFSLTERIYFLESLNPDPKKMKMITQATHVEIYLVTKFQTRKQFFNIFLSLFHLSISSRNWQTGSFLFSSQQTGRRVDSARISKIFLLRMQKFGKYYGRISRLLHFLTTCNISSFLARDWVCLLFNGLFFPLFDAILEFVRFLHGKQGKTKVGWVLKSPVETTYPQLRNMFTLEMSINFGIYYR